MLDVARGSIGRFRASDGYSHARALALQLALALIPFFLALTGLATAIHERSIATVIAQTVAQVSPGGHSSDALSAAVSHSRGTGASGAGAAIALGIGLLLSFGAATVALGQVERGCNRLFGQDDDRPGVTKYRHAAALTLLVGPLFSTGFVLVVAGGAFADAAHQQYRWASGSLLTSFLTLRWPLGLLLLIGALIVLTDRAPRRRQPGPSWLLVGSLTSLALTAAATGLLATYLHLSDAFGETYGPLAGVVALLIWTLFVSVALFYGVAVLAELEARHRSGAGV